RVLCCLVEMFVFLSVPLKSISVQLHVRDHVASVHSSLQYVNEEDRPLEAMFVFPLPADAAICHFSAKIGEQEIVAEVQDKESARDQYDDAVSSGQQAFLLEESDESSDVFRLSVGCLSPGQNASITIVYVIELSIQVDHALRFCLPAVLNPRYTPAASAASVPEVSSACVIPYTLSLSVDVRSSDRISRLESSCPLDPLEFLDAQHTHAMVNLSAGHRFDKDVELLLYYENTHRSTAVVEAGAAAAQSGSLMGDPALMISLYPEFPAEVMSSLASQREFVFLVDRSGSMSWKMHHGKGAQKRIESARDTLLLLLKSLPMGCYFNIYGFGSCFECFFPSSVVYSEVTMEEALRRVKSMSADMGGTEILQPLKHIYSQPCYPDHPRQLFVFTDGEVWNTKEVLDLVKSQTFSHRCFSFGIGEGASTALVTGMAREGSGHAQFITGTDRMQPKVMQSLRFALQPAVDDISVDWTVPEGVMVDMLSPPISALFQGQRALIYAQIKGQVKAVNGLIISSLQTKYNMSIILCVSVIKKNCCAAWQPLLTPILCFILNCCNTCFTVFCINADPLSELISDGIPNLGITSLVRNLITVPAPRSADGTASTHLLNRSMITSMYLLPCTLEPEPRMDPLLRLVSLQKAAGCWELNAALADVFGKTEDEVTNHRPAQVDGSVWATVLALIWLRAYKLDQRVEWQFVAMKAASWVRSQKPDGLSQCVCEGNMLLGSQVTEDALGI
uniref:von Willebrand factor A domain-containing protein 5A-like n=1 Tax=Cyprinus carpio TaxID=7962 RepID=A0A8C1MX67_CYPCA